MKYVLKTYIPYHWGKFKAKAIQAFYKILNPDTITKGSYVKCIGQNYPHWKGQIFSVRVVCKRYLILSNSIKVSKSDFFRFEMTLLSWDGKCKLCTFGPERGKCEATKHFRTVSGKLYTCNNASLFTLKP